MASVKSPSSATTARGQSVRAPAKPRATRTKAGPETTSASRVDATKPGAAPSTPPVASAAQLEPGLAKVKPKLVRDSFTIPKAEYAVLDALKKRAAKLEHPVKKSELLRAGINALNAMSDAAFLAAVMVVPSLKTGRPKHDKASQ